MKISCPACQSKYTIADEKVQGRAVKVRCRKCGEMIHVGGSSAASPASGVSPDPGAAAFSVLIAEGDQRDMSLQEIITAYNNGVITADTYVWGEGQADWAPLEQVATIVDAINQASASPDVTREVGSQQLQSEPPPVVAAAPAPAAEPPAKQAALFGGKPAPAVAPVAQDHAAIQKPKPRDVDLFGGRSKPEEDISTSAPVFPVAVQPKPTGTREESSMLFSLTALTAATPVQAQGPGAAAEDSGLIDLKELAAKADAPKPQSGLAVPFLDAAPLLGSPLIDVPATQEPEPEIKKSKSSMLIGVGISIAGVAIAAAIFFATRKPPPPPVTAAAPVDSPTLSEPKAVAAADDSSGAAPPATGAPSATAKTAVGGKGGRAGPAVKGGKGGKETPGGGETPAATTPAKPKSPCGCAPNDLMCNMNCAVGKK